MKTLQLSFEKYRLQLGREHLLNRLLDKDHSEARLFSDTKELDAVLIYPTEWYKHFDKKRYRLRLKNATLTDLECSQTHLNSKLMAD